MRALILLIALGLGSGAAWASDGQDAETPPVDLEKQARLKEAASKVQQWLSTYQGKSGGSLLPPPIPGKPPAQTPEQRAITRVQRQQYEDSQ